jgi:hypothetical protein
MAAPAPAAATLELFSGTQSFSKRTLNPITVDLLPKFKPTHTADMLTWDYRIYPPGHFDIVWASPPCTQYSKARKNAKTPPDLEGADALVRKAFEIIDYFQPRVWIVENPATGLLPKRMEAIRPGITGYVAHYCAYGKPYRKATMFWCNVPLVLRECAGAGVCEQMDGKKHKGSCGNGTERYNAAGISGCWEKDEIPPALIDDILRQTDRAATETK